jgi:hypothetical protein
VFALGLIQIILCRACVLIVGGVFDLCHLDDDVHLIFANTKFFGF